MFQRKIYDKHLEWKKESAGKTALLIEGARRIGKSTIVEAYIFLRLQLIYTKDLKKDKDILMMPVYLLPFMVNNRPEG